MKCFTKEVALLDNTGSYIGLRCKNTLLPVQKISIAESLKANKVN